MIEENVIKVNRGITININVSVKNSSMWKKYVWNPAKSNYKNVKRLACITNDSAITSRIVLVSYDEEINLNEKKESVKKNVFLYWLNFY